MKRILLLALAVALAWTVSAWAQQPNFYIEQPPGWSGPQTSLEGGLETQFVAPGQDAFIEVYAQPSGPVDLNQYADAWVREVVANGVPHHSLAASAMSQTNTGVPGLVREYTGHDQGNNFRSLLIFSQYNGYMYIVQGVYLDNGNQATANAVYTSLDSFGFPDSLHQGPGVQPSPQPQPAPAPQQGYQQGPGYQGQDGLAQMGSKGLVDRAWNDDGRCQVQWGLATGGTNGDCVFYVSTSRNINLHLRNATGNNQDLFRVEIADMQRNMALVAREDNIGAVVRKVSLPPGEYSVLVSGPGVPWKIYWD